MPTMTDKVYAFGNRRFVIHSLNADQNGYENNALHIQGLVNFSMDFTQETTAFEADDDPEFIAINGTPTGSGTATLRGLSNEDYPKIYPAISGTGKGVHFGEDLPVKYFGLIFDEQLNESGIQSINRYVIYKCRATNLPSIATASISGTSATPRDISINLAVAPIFWEEGGVRKRRIFSVFNSVADSAEFAKFEEGLAFPTITP